MDLFEAIKEGRDVLAAVDADPKLLQTKTPRGTTLAMFAAAHGNHALVEEFQKRGFDLNEVREDGLTALRFAVEQGFEVTARRLIELGASPRVEPSPWPMLRQALVKMPTIVALLIEHGLRIDQPDPTGVDSVLHLLSREGTADMLRAYIAAGGALDILDRGGRTALLAASSINAPRHGEIIDVLLAAGLFVDEQSLGAALSHGSIPRISRFIDAGADTTVVATWLGSLDVPEIRERLIKRGVAVPEETQGKLITNAEVKALGIDHDIGDGRALLMKGPLKIPSLRLDHGEDAWKGGPMMFAGFIVDGDLTVTKSIDNGEQDFGPFLTVFGNLTAKNVAIAGAPLHVRGDLTITGTFHGSYNHGSTRVDGALDASLFIAQDYSVVLNGEVRGDVLDDRGHFTSKRKIAFADFECIDPKFFDNDGLDSQKVYKAVVAGKSLRRT